MPLLKKKELRTVDHCNSGFYFVSQSRRKKRKENLKWPYRQRRQYLTPTAWELRGPLISYNLYNMSNIRTFWLTHTRSC